MIILCWNVRGLNKAGKVDSIWNYSNQQGCDIICLLEHKIKQDLSCILRKRWSGFDVLSNASSAPSGRILVTWNPQAVSLMKTIETEQFIQMEGTSLVDSSNFILSVVYAANEVGWRRKLWDDLQSAQPSLPWIITGDFNCIRRSEEKLGSDLLHHTAMSDFNDFIDSTSLLEMATTSSEFTWSNMSQSRPILCRLDCTLISPNCISLFPDCVTHVGPRLLSDHCLLTIQFGSERHRAKSQFKFYNKWIAHLDFIPLIAYYWRFQHQGNRTYRFVKKLAMIRYQLAR